jgi:hypothetical protein
MAVQLKSKKKIYSDSRLSEEILNKSRKLPLKHPTIFPKATMMYEAAHEKRTKTPTTSSSR